MTLRGGSCASIMSYANEGVSSPPESKVASFKAPKVLFPEQSELVKDGTLEKDELGVDLENFPGALIFKDAMLL